MSNSPINIDALKSGLPSAIDEDKAMVRRIISNEDDYDDESELKRARLGVFFTHVGLIRTAIANSMGASYIRNQTEGMDVYDDSEE